MARFMRRHADGGDAGCGIDVLAQAQHLVPGIVVVGERAAYPFYVDILQAVDI